MGACSSTFGIIQDINVRDTSTVSRYYSLSPLPGSKAGCPILQYELRSICLHSAVGCLQHCRGLAIGRLQVVAVHRHACGSLAGFDVERSLYSLSLLLGASGRSPSSSCWKGCLRFA